MSAYTDAKIKDFEAERQSLFALEILQRSGQARRSAKLTRLLMKENFAYVLEEGSQNMEDLVEAFNKLEKLSIIC